MQKKYPMSAFMLLGFGILFIFVGAVGSMYYQDKRENDCYLQAYSELEGNPNELVEISLEEKRSLNIGEGLTPTRIYYEMKKCMVR